MPKSWNNPIIAQEAQALMALTDDLEEPFEAAVAAIVSATGKTVCTGIGKSGHVATKVAATLTSVGVPALFLHPTDARHGHVGIVGAGDVLIAFSRSGRAPELISVFEHASELGIPRILVSENDQDSLVEYADIVLKMPAMKDGWGHAPTTSTIIQMAIGDAIAVTVGDRKDSADRMATISLAKKEAFTR